MQLATTDAKSLAEWASVARSLFPEPVTFHVLAQGYELRCGSLEPLRLEFPDQPTGGNA